jgi:hypothetical protein
MAMADPSFFPRYYSTPPQASLNSFAIFRAEVITRIRRAACVQGAGSLPSSTLVHHPILLQRLLQKRMPALLQ